jgi:hypothetical protein
MAKKAYSAGRRSRPLKVHERVAAYRKRMRAKGYKPVEIWVPDTNNPKFIARLQRWSRAVAKREKNDKALDRWLTATTAESFAEIDRAEEAAGAPYPFWDEKAEKPV